MAALPDLTVSATPSIICLGESAVLSYDGATAYSTGIVNGTTTGNTIAITPTTSSIYTITGISNCVALKTVTVNVNPCTGLNEMGLQKTQTFEVRLYPNPTNNLLYFGSNQLKTADIKLSNSLGQTLYVKQHADLSEPLDLNALKAGIYFVRVETILGQKTVKVVKE